MQEWLTPLLWTAGSLVLPSLFYLGVAHATERPRSHGVVAWVCLWVSQVVALPVLAAWVSLILGQDLYEHGYVLKALVYGIGGAAVAALVALRAAQVLAIGVSILRGATAAKIVIASARVREGTLVGLVGVVSLFMLTWVLFLPGEYTMVVYWLLVLAPCGIAATVLLLVASVTSMVVRPRRL